MTSNPNTPGTDAAMHKAGKQQWVAPEISTFEAVAVTKSIWARIGDGINNLS